MAAAVPLQAVVLVDSFTTKLGPITLECPKALVPLVNTPMIDRTIAWLESAADVKQVFVLCCWQYSKQIINYLEKSKWVNQPKPNFSVTAIESPNCSSVGDALRDVIQGDFILVSGDTVVTNMMLTQALEEHKQRKQNDNNNNAIMTMVIKQSEPTRDDDELIMAIDPTTKELMYYEDKTANDLKFDKSFLTVNPCLTLHNDKQDCYVDICSPQVLSRLFTKDFNFVDYQHLRCDFFKLVDDHLAGGFKIFTHEIDSSCYAARIDNFKSYKSITKDIIIQRTNNIPTKLSACIIGKDTIIGDKTVISNSVVGDGCKIGSNVAIDGCCIWNNVTIQDGCKLRGAVLCDGAVMKSGAVLASGVVLSFNVVVGPGFVVPRHSKVSLLPPQLVKQDSGEYAAADDNIVENGDSINDVCAGVVVVVSDMGEDGRGFIWPVSEVVHHEEEEEEEEEEWWRPSVVAPPKSNDEIFEEEVEKIFRRYLVHGNACIYIRYQVNRLRGDFGMTLAKCVGGLLRSVMKLALDTWRNNNNNNDLVKETNDVMSNWGKLLTGFSIGVNSQMHVIFKFEEMCLLESMKEYAPLFVEVLNILYDKNIIQKKAILKWANRKEQDKESDKVFVKQSENFIQRLKEEKDVKAQETDLKRPVRVKKRQRPLTETELKKLFEIKYVPKIMGYLKKTDAKRSSEGGRCASEGDV